MLQLMRKKAQSWMIKVIFGVIIIVFVFFYGYGRKAGKGQVIAEVNGAKIGESLFRSKYQQAYQNLVRLYQSIYKERFNEGMIDRLGLGTRVLNELIDETLLVQEAERLSLRVSPRELQAAIHSNPAFQVEGEFNEQRFMAVLQMSDMSVDEFQEMEERNRLITKLSDLISLGGVELSDQEILDAYALENEKINLQFVRFNPTDYKDSVSVEDSEMEAYYSENSTLFETPPKVQVQYVVFGWDDFLETVEIKPEEIREEYEINRDEYRIPKRVKVSHILITPEGDDGEESVDEARKKAEQILEQAEKGEDFATLAKEHSRDPDSAENGGSIGWVREGERAPEFAEQAFALEKGEIGPLIESEDGFHVVKLDDVEEARVKGFGEVEGEIRAELARAKSRQVAEAKAEEAFFTIYETKDLLSYAAERGLTLKTTGLFSKEERLEGVDGNLEFNGHAFSLEEGEVSSPLEIGGKNYLIKMIKRESPRVPAFEEVKEEVREAVLREKATEKAKAAAEEILEDMKRKKSLTESASEKGLKVDETGYFERGSAYVPQVGPLQDLGQGIFSLSLEKPILEAVVSYGSVFFVMALKEEQKVEMEEFEAEKEQYRQRVYAEKRGRVFQQWLDSLRNKSEIKIREDNLRL